MSTKKQRKGNRIARAREVERNRDAWNAKVKQNLEKARMAEVIATAEQIGHNINAVADDVGEALLLQLQWTEFKDSLEPRERLVAIRTLFNILNG